MTDYSFVTIWQINAPLLRVWDILADVERWPDWWTSIERVQVIEPGNANGIGERIRVTLRMPLHLHWTFDECIIQLQAPNLLELDLVDGQAGIDQFYLARSGNGTLFRYDLTLQISNRWMNWLMQIARPVVQWSHTAAVREGARGLARLLKTQVETEIETGEQDTTCFCDEPLARRT